MHWANQHREVVFRFESYHQKVFELRCGFMVDAFTSIKTDYENAFQEINTKVKTKDWLFGYLSYDLKTIPKFTIQ